MIFDDDEWSVNALIVIVSPILFFYFLCRCIRTGIILLPILFVILLTMPILFTLVVCAVYGELESFFKRVYNG